MSPQPLTSHKGHLDDPYWDRDHAAQLTAMVVLAQIVGLALILVGVHLLHDLTSDLKQLANRSVMVGLVALAAPLSCWWDDIANLFARAFAGSSESARKFKPVRESVRYNWLQSMVFALVVVDTTILVFVIQVTGGLGHSPLDPLLPIIPAIVIILRQPSKTVKLAIFFQGIITLASAFHQGLHLRGLPHLKSLEWPSYQPSTDPDFLLAFSVVAVGAMGLSLVEFYVTHQLPVIPVPELPKWLGLSPDAEAEFNRAIKRGIKEWFGWLESHGTSPRETSRVHSPDAVFSQAQILSLPHWLDQAGKKDRIKITQSIAFLTIASHWIDDHFDAMGLRCLAPGTQEIVKTQGPADWLACEPRVCAVVQRMKTLVPRERASQVDRAVKRIIFGGLIQHAPEKPRLNQMLREYFKLVRQGLSADLGSAYTTLERTNPLAVWATTKVVIELLDCLARDFSQDKSEFFNLLYGPILHYQDLENEIMIERFGIAFGSCPADVRQNLPSETDMETLVNEAAKLTAKLFEGGALPESRKMQLKLLRETYKDSLRPKVFEAYNSFL